MKNNQFSHFVALGVLAVGIAGGTMIHNNNKEVEKENIAFCNVSKDQVMKDVKAPSYQSEDYMKTLEGLNSYAMQEQDKGQKASLHASEVNCNIAEMRNKFLNKKKSVDNQKTLFSTPG